MSPADHKTFTVSSTGELLAVLEPREDRRELGAEDPRTGEADAPLNQGRRKSAINAGSALDFALDRSYSIVRLVSP
jgi:hypothetical protein